MAIVYFLVYANQDDMLGPKLIPVLIGFITMCNKYCAITVALIAFLIVNETIITWYLDLGNVVCEYRGVMDQEWWAISIYIAAIEITFSVIMASAVWGCGIVAIARERRGDIITYAADNYTGGNVRLD